MLLGLPLARSGAHLTQPILLVYRRSRAHRGYGPKILSVHGRRQLHIPTILLPPVIFTGLLLALYTWKSFVMVSLQNKIIYAPYLPPTARHEKISDWKSRLYGIEWKELHMRSIDRTDLALAVASVSSVPGDSPTNDIAYHVYILYCQGLSCLAPFGYVCELTYLRQATPRLSRLVCRIIPGSSKRFV